MSRFFAAKGALMISALATFSVAAPAIQDPIPASASSVESYISSIEAKLARGEHEEVARYSKALIPNGRFRIFLKKLPTGPLKPGIEGFLAGLNVWESETNGLVAFEPVPTARDAHVVLEFKDDLTYQGAPVAGHARWLLTQNGLSVRIQIRTKAPNGKPLSAGCILHSVAHELGHVLGLDDGTDGVMGPVDVRNPRVKPSPSEVERVIRIRGRIRAITTEAIISR